MLKSLILYLTSDLSFKRTSCAPPSTIEVGEITVSFALFLNSSSDKAPQLHIVDLIFEVVTSKLSCSEPAYGTYESTPSAKDRFFFPPIS